MPGGGLAGINATELRAAEPCLNAADDRTNTPAGLLGGALVTAS